MRYLVLIGFVSLSACAAGTPPAPNPQSVGVTQPAMDAAQAAEGKVFFARMFAREPAVQPADPAAITTALGDVVDPDITQRPTIDVTEVPQITAPAGQETGGGLLGIFKRTAATPEVELAPNAGPVVYGRFVKVCGMNTRDMGQKVDSAGGFTLYDTNPTSSLQRTHFVTGFRDTCARQFTAALAMFGAPSLHELMKYREKHPTFTPLDLEYEKVKSTICRVPEKTPCEKRSARLDKRATFLSIYRAFGSDDLPADVFLAQGRVVASDFDG